MPSPAVKRVAGANPAAGAEVSEVVPAGTMWELLSVRVALVQGLTQTPQPILQITDPNDNVVFGQLGATAAMAVSTTATFTWGVGLALTALLGATPEIRAYAPILDKLVLPAGWKIKTLTLGIGANSDYGAPALLVVERG